MIDPISARILGAIKASLTHYIKPELDSPEGRLHVDMVLRAVDFVRSRQTSLIEDMRALLNAERRQVMEAAQLLGRKDGWPMATPGGDVMSGSVMALEELRTAYEAALSAFMPSLLTLATGTTPRAADAGALLRRIVESQSSYTASQDPESALGTGSVFAKGRLEDEHGDKVKERPIDARGLTEYLQRRFPQRRATIADVKVIPGGYSKRTVFFTLRPADAPPEKCVIRMDIPGPMDRSVRGEFPLLEHVHAAGIPVAKPLWLEADATVFGGAFMVSEHRAGRIDHQPLIDDPTRGDAFGRQLAATLAQLHSLPAERFDPDAAKLSAAECTRRDITRYFDYYRNHKRVPQPLLDLQYSWLLTNIPSHLNSQPPSLIHGDVGFHNILIEDGRLNALLDWETSHLGDPAEDLYYAKPFVTQIMPWDQFLSYYYQHGGKPCPPESEAFYRVWRGARIAGNVAKIRDAYENETPDAITYAVVSYVFGRRLELESANALAQLLP